MEPPDIIDEPLTFEDRARFVAKYSPTESAKGLLSRVDNWNWGAELNMYQRNDLMKIGNSWGAQMWARWILDDGSRDAEAVRDFMAQDRKINAIKEMRGATLLGLKEAKEAVEEAQALLNRGYVSTAERERIETESARAVESILTSVYKGVTA